jgi:SAM-dependent methyltransferase
LDEERTVPARCPICSDEAHKRQLLTVSSTLSGARAVVRCANCEAVFIPDLPAWPYDAFPTEFVQLYIEQGASIDLMVQPLFAVPRSSVRRYLEVGCGFGFGVDFAEHVLGWSAIGLEPSQLGLAGRAALGIDLRAEYLDENAAFPELHDLVFSSEVLEHVPEPRPFLRAAVRALAPHGVLMLTTPNAARLTPAASEYSQLSILSFPLHAILYTRRTLERLLTEVGLPFVHVIERDDTLIAMASSQEFTPLDARLDHAEYQTYLGHRLTRLEPGTPVATGYAYRWFKECVNRADYAGAELALESLRREMTLRFGAERGRLTPQLGRQEASFEAYARTHPLNLCGCYYFQGILALNHQLDAELAGRFFDAARVAGEHLRKLLWTMGVDDGETEDLVAQATLHSKLAWTRAKLLRPAGESSAPEPKPESVSAVEAKPEVTSEPESAPDAQLTSESAVEPQVTPELEPELEPRGYLDEVTEAGVASGWAFDPASPLRAVTVQLCVDGEPVTSIVAEVFRSDLAAKKIGNGCHGFSEDLSPFLVEERMYTVSARVAGVELESILPVRGRAPLKKANATPKVDATAFLHVEHEPRAAAQLARESRRLAIVVFYQPLGRVFAYHRRLLQELKGQGFATVLVRNGSENLASFVDSAKSLADLVLVRDNAGLDFSAWISALNLLGVELNALDELIFANDSVIGPLFPLREAMTRMSAAECDFWGMTDNWAHAYHLQSYFLCFKQAALRSPAFAEYLRHYSHPTDKDEVIAEGEIGLTQTLLAADLRPAAYCPYTEVARRWLQDLPRRMAEVSHSPEAQSSATPDEPMQRLLCERAGFYSSVAGRLRAGQPLNSSHYFWDTLIRDFRFPFIKKDLLLRNPVLIPNVGDVHALVESRTEFPIRDLLEVFLLNPGVLAPPLPLIVEQPRSHVESTVAGRIDVLS